MWKALTYLIGSCKKYIEDHLFILNAKPSKEILPLKNSPNFFQPGSPEQRKSHT